MLDYGHIQTANTQAQEFVGTLGESRVFPVTLPRNRQYLHIICLGAGGNGGPGFAAAAGSAKGGGGGGGPGAYAAATYHRSMLPDTIFVMPGSFGIQNTYVSLTVTPSAQTSLLFARNGLVGGTGTGAAGGNAGLAGANTGQDEIVWSNMAMAFRSANSAAPSGNGGITTGNNAVQFLSIPNGGGAGGGGANTTTGFFTGGGMNLTSISVSLITATGPTIANTPGITPMISRRPLILPGGTGGGGATATAGMPGGDGNWGAGGGGGGGGTTGGLGGRGGPGYVILLHF